MIATALSPSAHGATIRVPLDVVGIQAAINAARTQLPANLVNNPTYRKVNPADDPIIFLALTSASLPLSQLNRYGQDLIAQRLATEESATPLALFRIAVGLVVLSTLLWADITKPYVWLVLAAMVGFGAIGFVDDYLKFIKRQSKGLSAGQKFSAQVAIALAIAVTLYFLPGYTTKLSVPFFKNFMPDLGWFYIVFAVLVIVGSSNAVNLTDGLDGLAIGPVMITALAYTIVAYVAGHRLMSDYLFGRAADKGHWWGTVLYSVVPNWQLFWVADALETGRSTFHWGYVGKAFGYAACYISAALMGAVILFENRELS